MTTLLGSIFGNKTAGADKKKDEEDAGGLLFEQSSALPERPQHKPRAKRILPPTNTEEGSDPNGDEPVKKKRKERKPKKTEEEKAAEAKAEETPTAEDGAGGIRDDQEDRTIYVGNLPLATTTRRSLAKLFKECGAIESTRIRNVPIAGVKLPPQHAGDQDLVKKVCANTNQVDESLKNTVQGYVVFKNKESVEKALEKNNTVIKEKGVDNFTIRVDRATPTIDPARSVFVGNLPYKAEEATLKEFFVKGCDLTPDQVEGVRIIRDKDTHQCKGFGYVLFQEKNMVSLALKLHDKEYMKRKLRVMVAGKRFKNKKGNSGNNDTKGTDSSSPSKKKMKSGKPERQREQVTVGAFRRILQKTQKDLAGQNKRKRGEKKKTAVKGKSSTAGLSKRAAIEKKVDKKVRKLQKRAAKGMGKMRK